MSCRCQLSPWGRDLSLLRLVERWSVEWGVNESSKGAHLGNRVLGRQERREFVVRREERQALIDQYALGAEAVERALAHIPPSLWTAHPLPGKWSAAEIVHHLADSEMTSAIRLRRLLAEECPAIVGYDQDLYAERLRYNERPLEPSLEAFRAARSATLPLLERMTEEDWQRAGTHSESGRYSAEDWLRIYAAHAHGHADQLQRLAEALLPGPGQSDGA